MMLQPSYLGLLQRLDELKHQLPRSERRIAETVIDKPEIVSYMRLSELAQAADVSIATVHRFCRSLGCDGFKELRQEISRSMLSTAQHSAPSTQRNVSNHALPRIIGEINQSLNALHTNVNEAALDKATNILNDADRAIMYTNDEDFHSTVQECTSLLYKAGLPCEPQLSERAMGRTVPTLKKNDLAIFVVTGRSPEPSDWMGSIKQLGGNSLSFTVGEMHTQQSADVSIRLERDPANQYSQLIAQVGLTILLAHLSSTVLTT
ncbi:MAG: MurR/RpiR family transcriptional regulator [Granulosicoccaceae bacterium]